MKLLNLVSLLVSMSMVVCAPIEIQGNEGLKVDKRDSMSSSNLASGGGMFSGIPFIGGMMGGDGGDSGSGGGMFSGIPFVGGMMGGGGGGSSDSGSSGGGGGMLSGIPFVSGMMGGGGGGKSFHPF